MVYHITQRKINIRKETSMTISVFSIASYTSMLALLAQVHSPGGRAEAYPPIPILVLARRVWLEFAHVVARLAEYVNATKDL